MDKAFERVETAAAGVAQQADDVGSDFYLKVDGFRIGNDGFCIKNDG